MIRSIYNLICMIHEQRGLQELCGASIPKIRRQSQVLDHSKPALLSLIQRLWRWIISTGKVHWLWIWRWFWNRTLYSHASPTSSPCRSCIFIPKKISGSSKINLLWISFYFPWLVQFFLCGIFLFYNLKNIMQKFQGGKIGTTLTGRWFAPLNETSDLDQAAARRAFQFFVGWYVYIFSMNWLSRRTHM